MPQSSSRNRIIAVVAIIVVLLLLALVRCRQTKPPEVVPPTTSPLSPTPAAAPSGPAPGEKPPAEILGAATLQAPAQVNAGKPFAVTWTGPNNARDYITIVRPDAAAHSYANYRDTKEGSPVEPLAPIEAGDWELRYVTGASKTVLARIPLRVVANAVTLQAPAEVIAGTSLQVSWTGPNNAGDYLTLVPKTLPDGQYGNYTNTSKGSPLAITAPIADGEAELRYMTGQGAKVLERFPVRVIAATIELSGPVTAAASSQVTVTWTGPNNPGDYLTIVPQSLPEGQYAGYAYTDKGPTLSIPAPKSAGLGEIRYVAGQGHKILKRRPILITP